MSRRTLGAKQKKLRKEGKGRKPNKAAPVSSTDINLLWDRGEIGFDNPRCLLNLVWFNNAFYFGWSGNDEHTKLLFGDLRMFTE